MTMWPKAYRDAHWQKLDRRWMTVERKFRKDVEDWMYRQRSGVLDRLLSGVRSVPGMMVSMKDALDAYDPTWWGQQLDSLKKTARENFTAALDMEGQELLGLFLDMGMPTGGQWSIWDHGAVSALSNHVNRGTLADITDTLRTSVRDRIEEGIKQGLTEDDIADSIRDVYAAARGRAGTIARTELGGVLNESRNNAFISEGFEYQSWLSARDEKVREAHQIDGEVVKMGEEFSNGLKYPNDPDGEPEEICNCRCVALPEPSKEGGGWISEESFRAFVLLGGGNHAGKAEV
jgi:SPP1 gp7 family putative phage head morphogenesis protein